MSTIKSFIALVGTFGFLWFIVIAIAFIIGACLWPYTINSWLVYADKEPVIEWWMGGLMGLVPGIGQASIPAAFVTFILMLFLGG